VKACNQPKQKLMQKLAQNNCNVPTKHEIKTVAPFGGYFNCYFDKVRKNRKRKHADPVMTLVGGTAVGGHVCLCARLRVRLRVCVCAVDVLRVWTAKGKGAVAAIAAAACATERALLRWQ
jgi:hypothetical protein